LKKVIEEGITKKNSHVANVASVPSPNWSEIHREFVYVMFQEIDPEITNRLTQQQFCLALEKDWKTIINTSINQGASQRQFTKRLRETTQKKQKESEEKGGTSTPKKPKIDKSEQSSSLSKKSKKATKNLDKSELSGSHDKSENLTSNSREGTQKKKKE
jgi:hypothetical protein